MTGKGNTSIGERAGGEEEDRKGREEGPDKEVGRSDQTVRGGARLQYCTLTVQDKLLYSTPQSNKQAEVAKQKKRTGISMISSK